MSVFKSKIVFSTVPKLAMAPPCAVEELPLTVRCGVREARVSASLTLQQSDWVGFDNQALTAQEAGAMPSAVPNRCRPVSA
jgi:hypothetical protein